MKICQLISSYPLASGGMQTYCYDLSRRLSKLGHHVHIYVSGNKGNLKESKNFKVTQLNPLFTIGKATFSPSILNRLLKDKFDVIHVHLPFHFGFEMALLVAKLKKIPIVVTYHCEATNYEENIIKGVFMKLYNTLNRVLIKKVDNIIFTTEDYSKLFKFHKDRVSIIPIGVDANNFKIHDKNSSREYLKLPKDKFIILFVGNLDTHNFYKKGAEYLLNSIPLIKKSMPNVFVNLVGVTDSNTEKIINSICEKKGIKNNVRVSGYVSSRDLPFHYSSSNVFVLPSVSKLEAFGIVLLEAMASGLPIVASNIPGVRSVAESSKAGFVVEPRSSSNLAKTIIKVSKIKNLDKYAIDTVNKKYNWDKIVKDIEEVYKNILIKK